jgi:transposase
VRNKLCHNPQSGQYFVFINARKTQMKVLYFESSGYCVWAKRLEQGQFPVKPHPSGIQSLTGCTLQMIVDGITVLRQKQAKRYGQSIA